MANGFFAKETESDYVIEDKTPLLAQIGGAIVEGFDYTGIGAIMDYAKLKRARETGPKLDPNELNKQYPWLDKPFLEPTSQTAADLIAQNYQESYDRRQLLANGDDSVLSQTLVFGAGIIPSIIDPVGIALGVGVGAGVLKAMGAGVKGARIGLGAEITSNVAGNLVTDFGLVNPVQDAYKKDVDTYDSLINSVVGGAALPLAAKAVGAGIKGARKLLNWDDADIAKGLHVVDAQMQKGLVPDLEDTVAVMEKQKNIAALTKEIEAFSLPRREVDVAVEIANRESRIAEGTKMLEGMPRQPIEIENQVRDITSQIRQALDNGDRPRAVELAGKLDELDPQNITASRLTIEENMATLRGSLEDIRNGPSTFQKLNDALEAEQAKIMPSREQSLKRANSEEAGLYYDPEVVRMMDEVESPSAIQPTEFETKLKADLDELMATSGAAGEPNADVVAIQAELDNIKNIEEMSRAATFCISGGGV